MATVQQIKDAINNANTLGRTNLAEKGVTVDDTATTYQIMQKISELTDAFIITVTLYRNGGYCTIDKTYAEILSASQAGKTIVMVDPITLFKPTELPLVLSPYSVNSDGSGTFIAITKWYEEVDMRYHEAKYYITVYPDDTAKYSWEELSETSGTIYRPFVEELNMEISITDYSVVLV